MVLMSRRSKVVLAASFAFAAVAAWVWAWFLSRHGLDKDSELSGVLQGFGTFLGVPALAVGVLALRTPDGDGTAGQNGDGQTVKVRRIKAHGNVDVNVHQVNTRP